MMDFILNQALLLNITSLARYRGQSLQAENFYRHAVDLVPSNGNTLIILFFIYAYV